MAASQTSHFRHPSLKLHPPGSPGHCKVFPGQVWHHPSNMFWVCPREASRRQPNQLPELLKVAPFNAEVQWFYSKLWFELSSSKISFSTSNPVTFQVNIRVQHFECLSREIRCYPQLYNSSHLVPLYVFRLCLPFTVASSYKHLCLYM